MANSGTCIAPSGLGTGHLPAEERPDQRQIGSPDATNVGAGDLYRAGKLAGPPIATLTMPTHILKVTLAHIRPAISRTVRVPSDFTLSDLHDVIQLAFGWENYHLHEFKADDAVFGVPDVEDDRDLVDERTVPIGEVLPRKGASAEYIYDYGDWWVHNVVVERIEMDAPARKGRGLRKAASGAAVECIDAKRACPPEDCGGPFGYGEFLEALTDPEHERHDELTEWIGGAFDAEAVSLSAINRRLASLG